MGERAGLLSQTELGSNLDLSTRSQVNSSKSSKYFKPKIGSIAQWGNSDLSELMGGLKKILEDKGLAGCLIYTVGYSGVFCIIIYFFHLLSL